MPRLLPRLIPLLLPLALQAAEVKVSENERTYTLDNGVTRAVVDRRTGNLDALWFAGADLLKGGGGYWSFVGESDRHSVGGAGARATSSVRARTPERAEVAVHLEPSGRPGELPASAEYRYALLAGDPGLYVSAVYHHAPGRAPFSLGEARYVVKLDGGLFDHLTVDAKRNGPMPSGADWEQGAPLNLKEARRMTTGRFKGKAEHKYGYSALLAETPAYGWCSTAKGLGVWMINPSMEYIAGGPTKMELTGHLDGGRGGRPVLLNMWLGSHYGGSTLKVERGEDWRKQIGPFVLYPNRGADPAALWRDALKRAESDRAHWPFAWAQPQPARGAVSGRLDVSDPRDSSLSPANIRVGLAAPGVDWQKDAKYGQYWTRADADGRFLIPHVPPGRYTLHAFADGVLGGLAREGVTVAASATNDLRIVRWTPEHKGRIVWQIGRADRTAEEFRHGAETWRWGRYLEYPKDFPDDVKYVIGKSDPARDWNYCQPHRSDRRTVWTVQWNESAVTPGRWALRLAFCGARGGTRIAVSVNGRPAGDTGWLPESGAMHRDAARGYWFERTVEFDAALLRPGTNTVSLALHSSVWHQGVLYDCVRLEAPPALRIALAGDSTVCNYPDTHACRGWGQYLGAPFQPGVTVLNHARSGRSTRTFIGEGRWRDLLAEKPDVVLIQFGHNDSHAPGRPESTDAATTYREFLRRYVDEARAAGAKPVLVTPMVRRTFAADGTLNDALLPYAEAMKAVAAETKTPLVDLHAASGALVLKQGPEGAKAFANAPGDMTHFNEAGARAMADLVLRELFAAEPSLSTWREK